MNEQYKLDAEFKLQIAELIIDNVSRCVNCEGCKDAAKKYMEMIKGESGTDTRDGPTIVESKVTVPNK